MLWKGQVLNGTLPEWLFLKGSYSGFWSLQITLLVLIQYLKTLKEEKPRAVTRSESKTSTWEHFQGSKVEIHSEILSW